MIGEWFKGLQDAYGEYAKIDAFRRNDGTIDYPMWALYLRSSSQERERILKNVTDPMNNAGPV